MTTIPRSHGYTLERIVLKPNEEFHLAGDFSRILEARVQRDERGVMASIWYSTLAHSEGERVRHYMLIVGRLGEDLGKFLSPPAICIGAIGEEVYFLS